MVTQAIETRAPARRLEKTPLSPSGVFFLALPVARMSGATAGNIGPNIAHRATAMQLWLLSVAALT